MSKEQRGNREAKKPKKVKAKTIAAQPSGKGGSAVGDSVSRSGGGGKKK